MNIWIATTGNSDVQLITDDNWSYLYEKERFNSEDSNREDSNRQDLSNQDFELTSLDVDNYEDIYTAPARVLGIVYGKEFENHCCLLYTSPSPRDCKTSRMPSSA